jgi:hypothetical protein
MAHAAHDLGAGQLHPGKAPSLRQNSNRRDVIRNRPNPSNFTSSLFLTVTRLTFEFAKNRRCVRRQRIPNTGSHAVPEVRSLATAAPQCTLRRCAASIAPAYRRKPKCHRPISNRHSPLQLERSLTPSRSTNTPRLIVTFGRLAKIKVPPKKRNCAPFVRPPWRERWLNERGCGLRVMVRRHGGRDTFVIPLGGARWASQRGGVDFRVAERWQASALRERRVNR